MHMYKYNKRVAYTACGSLNLPTCWMWYIRSPPVTYSITKYRRSYDKITSKSTTYEIKTNFGFLGFSLVGYDIGGLNFSCFIKIFSKWIPLIRPVKSHALCINAFKLFF